jgi:hypothetical protein
MSQPEFQSFMAPEVVKWAKVINDNHIATIEKGARALSRMRKQLNLPRRFLRPAKADVCFRRADRLNAEQEVTCQGRR